MRTPERRIPHFIFMIPIVRVVKKVSEKKKMIIIRFFLYEKFKELDYISNHKIQCTCI